MASTASAGANSSRRSGRGVGYQSCEMCTHSESGYSRFAETCAIHYRGSILGPLR